MPIPGKLVIYGPDGKPLNGSLPIADPEILDLTGCPIEEFGHRVWTQLDKINFFCDWTNSRVHEPIRIVKPFDRFTIPLYRFFTKGIFLPKVELRWFRHGDGKKELYEWYRITLEHVRVFSVKQMLYNIKDRSKERCGHAEEVCFVYQRITWLRTPGYVIYTDEWNKGFYDEFNEKDFNPKNDDEGDIAITSPKVLSVSASGWDHEDDNRRKESPNEVREGDVILLQAEIDVNPRDGERVRFELYFKRPNKNELSLQFDSVSGTVKNSVASAVWTVDFSNINKRKSKSEQVKEYEVHFEAVVRSRYGAKCPIGICKPEDPVEPVDRWIIFEETAEKIDPDFTYKMSKAQAPKYRWIYVFGSQDGSNFSHVWEIRTDSAGKKFATIELTKDNSNSRPMLEPWEDVAFLPGQDSTGKSIKLYACVSDVRLPRKRIFDKSTGLLIKPQKRCYNIDDPKQAAKKLLDDGEEKIVILNTMLHAELLRKRFDDIYPKWEEVRRASWLENDESKKKEKLVYEFGALIIRIIEAYPAYRKHIAPGCYPKLYEHVKSYDEKKVRMTTDITYRIDALCRYLNSGHFAETCKDYISLIRLESSQRSELYSFEDRVGKLVENITRFQQGVETIKKLLPHVKNKDEHSWLQDLLLLKSDTWSVTDNQNVVDSHQGMSGEKKFQNIRKLGDGAVKLLIEGAKAGVAIYKPEELANILQKVFATTGESIEIGITAVKMTNNSIRPFQKVLGSFDKKSFWRFEFKGQSPYENMFAYGLRSAALKKLLMGLEGVALIYSLKDHEEKRSAGKAGWLDDVNVIIKLVTYFVKSEMIKVPYKGELVKLGGGPVAVANLATTSIDAYMAFQQTMKDWKEYDCDTAIFNSIALVGNITAATGYASIVATFFAGSAAASSTGIGIAPGLLLAFTGSVIAIAGKVLATEADNTPMENMLLRTPWGTHPVQPEPSLTTAELQKQYLRAIRLINNFRVSIDHDSMTATLHLRRLEPTTVITIHEVTIGIPTRADGSDSTSQVVGTELKLNDSNSEIIHNNAASTVDLRVNLAKVCSGVVPFLQQWKRYYNSFGKEPKPDYIKLIITVDLDGDGVMILPDERKKLCVEKLYGQMIKTIID